MSGNKNKNRAKKVLTALFNLIVSIIIVLFFTGAEGFVEYYFK